MQNMSVKKSAAAPPREGSASAVRAAARSGAPERSTTVDRPKRRKFTAEYKLRILRETDASSSAGEGAIGEVLRREGLYSAYLTAWRRERDQGQLEGLTPKKRGRKASKNALADENVRLQRELERVQQELAKANTVIDVQRKVAALLGETLPEPTTEELERGRGRFRTGRLDLKPGRRS
jgi:transposase-like protein